MLEHDDQADNPPPGVQGLIAGTSTPPVDPYFSRLRKSRDLSTTVPSPQHVINPTKAWTGFQLKCRSKTRRPQMLKSLLPRFAWP